MTVATSLELDRRMARIDAVHQVQNLMSRYCYFHVANQHEGCFALSAVDTPGVRAELPFGTYLGRAGLERLYLGFFGQSDARPEGKMHLHTLTTPVIEVAGDLRTAKGVWIAPGHATDRFGGTTVTASWRWTTYGADFVQEHGQWKIWHLKVYGIFATPYDKSWVETAPPPGTSRPGPPPMPEQFRPDRPAGPFWQYAEDAAYPGGPALPEPYETFDEASAY